MSYPTPPLSPPSDSFDKPRVLFLGEPQHTGGGIKASKKDFEIDVCDLPDNAQEERGLIVLPYKILRANNRAELLAKLPSFVASRGPYEAIICRLGTQPFEPFDAELLSPLLPYLRIIVSAQIGYDDFDVKWMTDNGIWFCNTRYATGEATANMALFLILAVLRNTSRAEANLRQGLWRQDLALSRDPAGLTLGIVGMGNIGKHLARKAAALGMQIRYWNRSGRCRDHHDNSDAVQIQTQPQQSDGPLHQSDGPPSSSQLSQASTTVSYWHSCSTLHELLATSDVVSLHCPHTAETTNLIGKDELAALRDGACIVNTARGPLIDQDALIAALESGKVLRAGLDVFVGEPHRVHPYFMTSDRVTVQPHMGGLTTGSFARAERECFDNIYAYFRTGRPVAPVNEVGGGRRGKEGDRGREIQGADAAGPGSV